MKVSENDGENTRMVAQNGSHLFNSISISIIFHFKVHRHTVKKYKILIEIQQIMLGNVVVIVEKCCYDQGTCHYNYLMKQYVKQCLQCLHLRNNLLHLFLG